MKNILFRNKIIGEQITKIPSYFQIEDMPDHNFNKDIDTIIHDKIQQFHTLSEVKSITIPLSLTDHLMEFSGLRFGHHIRLSKNFAYKDVPLIFYGVFTEVQILKLTKLSHILLTPRVYYFNIVEHSLTDLAEFVKNKTSDFLPNFQLTDFLDKISIEIPDNYQSRHSIANEWALTRYFSILKPNVKITEYEDLKRKVETLNYTKTLHYKYSDCLFSGQVFNPKKHSYNLIINNIKDKVVGVIDDELEKGWKEFYTYLFSQSGMLNNNYHYYEKFKHKVKADLIVDLKAWCEEKINNGCTIFVIDLRLHADDFFKENTDELTGIQIVKYIKEKNPGVQIVISTASNKVWNFQKCISMGINKFSVKESPETNNKREETKNELIHFVKNIEAAASESFLAKLYRDIQDLKQCVCFENNDSEKEFKKAVLGRNGIIDQIWNVLLKDSFDDTMLNQCLLLCFSVLEKYTNLTTICNFEQDESTRGGNVFGRNNEMVNIFTANSPNEISTLLVLKYGTFSFQINTHQTPISIEYYHEKVLKSAYHSGLDVTALVKIVSVLKYRDKIDESRINELLKLRYYRSNIAAHNTGNIDQSKYKISAHNIVWFIDLFIDIFKI